MYSLHYPPLVLCPARHPSGPATYLPVPLLPAGSLAPFMCMAISCHRQHRHTCMQAKVVGFYSPLPRTGGTCNAWRQQGATLTGATCERPWHLRCHREAVKVHTSPPWAAPAARCAAVSQARWVGHVCVSMTATNVCRLQLPYAPLKCALQFALPMRL